MLHIVFSKSALVFYLFVLLTEFITKHGIRETEVKGKSYVLPWADLCGLCALVYIIVYSLNSVWWAFIALIVAYVIIFRIVNFIIVRKLIRPPYLLLIAKRAKLLMIPLIIVMFALIRK